MYYVFVSKSLESEADDGLRKVKVELPGTLGIIEHTIDLTGHGSTDKTVADVKSSILNGHGQHDPGQYDMIFDVNNSQVIMVDDHDTFEYADHFEKENGIIKFRLR
ncbi:unnamed protein product [Lymnaea stagnalis]|uniref:Uncharacterized protein n=1 Tax=Lymnaea stagnalis TaxID=6523 RepID=A0AAV2I653_LYMST